MPIGRGRGRRAGRQRGESDFERLCYYLWATEGSLDRASFRLYDEAKIAYSNATIWASAIRFAARYTDEARDILIKHGDVWANNEEQFCNYVLSCLPRAVRNEDIYHEMISREPLSKYVKQD